MSSASPLRVGLIALGGVNRWLFRPAIQKSDQMQLVAGVSPSASSRDAFVQSWPISVYERFDQMIEREKLDAVVIGSPTHLHLQHIREAAAAGLHVHVTKPLCNTVAECEEAIDVANRAGIVLQVGHEFRYRPPIRKMIELARQPDGPVGTATMLMMHMGHAGGLKEDVSDSWRTEQNVPGGCGNLLGVHGIDLANALFGKAKSVSGTFNRFCSRLSMDDTASITITYDHAVAIITASYASQPLESVSLLGTRGNLLVRDNRLMLEANRQSTVVEGLAEESAVDVLLRQFASAIRGGGQIETGGREGLSAIAVLQEALSAS